MKKYKNYIIGFVLVLIGMVLGNLFSGGNSTIKENHEHKLTKDAATQLWTCSMHPQIKMQEPGNCPICGMELIPLETNTTSENINVDEIVLSESAYQLGNIQTSVVQKSQAEKEIRLLGKVQANERNLYSQVSHIPGRIEKLYVNFTGENVSKGQKIARIYSPELISAQKELFEAINSKKVYPALYTASRNKLKLWKLTDYQIDAIEKSGNLQEQIDILSDYSGYVIKRNVEVGDYLQQGSTLFDVANLNTVWILFDAYEADIQWINIGDIVEYTIQALPGESFTSKVSYIDPFISSGSRVAKVRVEMSNTSHKLLPEMFANGIIKASLKNTKDALIVPKTAVLWTGKKSVVYVKVPHKNTISFVNRTVNLGADLGNFYIVENGLNEGEIVATNGVFKIDASAQLIGKQSMMNPKNEKGTIKNEAINNIQISFGVRGNCSMCKATIEKAALNVDGVKTAIWDVDKKKITLEFDDSKTNEIEIHKAITLVGYDTDKMKANNEAYNNLPSCCLYSKEMKMNQ
ncbi:efflux RND transporter periplasmic adaptor subunit [Lutibacter sp. HS1-25]|uniref:efflux RND transporter periplasmic adaptor subunit n=1 Tax=Lutibacter sp. HS1-25 TaxID=2485000 RepID=UPI001010B57C|nr:efflux RND transporter periplasmic adaptor subunit [Lutibacter sp. HS1-25]RXP44975.1 efflux RND transporter periplasmic adaptor subunit [Lutibacter sp. HS1-25]